MAKKIKFNVVNKLPVKVGAKNKPKKKIKFNVVKRKPIPTPRKPIPAPRKKKHPYAMGDTNNGGHSTLIWRYEG